MTGYQELLDLAFTMPTAVFSVLLVLVTLYWLLSLLGLFNLEMLDAADGLLELLGLFNLEMLDAADGLLDGADALGDGADALGDGADALADGADGALPDAGHRPGFFANLGFGDVPRSISWSLVIFFGWLFSFAGSVYLPQFTANAARGLTLVTVAAGLVSLGLGLVATTVAIQPMRKLILAGYGTKRIDLVGRVCTVRTLRVDGAFGQAELDDGSSIIQVRNPQGYDFQEGSQALIYEYDKAREVFYIMPADLESG